MTQRKETQREEDLGIAASRGVPDSQAAGTQEGGRVETPLEQEISAALHHLQADGPIARGSLANTLRTCKALTAANEKLTAELSDAQYWRERHGRESIAAHQQSGQNWQKWKDAEARLAAVEKALGELVRVVNLDEPRQNEWLDAIMDAERALSGQAAASTSEAK